MKITKTNVSEFYDLLSPPENLSDPIEKFKQKIVVQAKRIGYFFSHFETVNDKKIYKALDLNPAVKEEPNLARLYNATVDRLHINKTPINLLDLAKKNVLSNPGYNISENLADYGLSVSQKKELGEFLAIQRPQEFIANHDRYGMAINEPAVNQQSQPSVDVVAAPPPPSAPVYSQFQLALEDALKANNEEEFQADKYKLDEADRKILNIVANRAHNDSGILEEGLTASHLLKIAQEADRLWGYNANHAEKREALRFKLAWEELEKDLGSSPEEQPQSFIGLQLDDLNWDIKDRSHLKNILLALLNRFPKEITSYIHKYAGQPSAEKLDEEDRYDLVMEAAGDKDGAKTVSYYFDRFAIDDEVFKMDIVRKAMSHNMEEVLKNIDKFNLTDGQKKLIAQEAISQNREAALNYLKSLGRMSEEDVTPKA